MPAYHRKLLVASAIAALLASPLAISHFDDKEVLQSYRQSWFTMLAVNFGPMVETVKGNIPWDDARMAAAAQQLATLTSMDISRGFADGSDKGTTRAKPEIWASKADFQQKMDDLDQAAQQLLTAANSGDRKATAAQIAAVGESCKACHDEYKSKDYLY